MANPWNAGPGELPGDPENDPALYSICEKCHRHFPNGEVWFWDSLGQWLCEQCRWDDEHVPPDRE